MEVAFEWLPMAAMLGLGWRWAVRFEDRIDRRLASHGERLAALGERLASHGERIMHIEGLLERRAG